jgi:uncharacterized protein (TIGR02145 family)
MSKTKLGIFTDVRDGQTYRTVKIGTQVWMAQNLNYKPKHGNSWRYKDDESMEKKYGRLYDWHTAKVVSPKGWHLPSRGEWHDLLMAVDRYYEYKQFERRMFEGESRPCLPCDTRGKKLKAKRGWREKGNGTNDFGFSALPGGCYDGSGFRFAGYYGFWWTASENDSGNACWLYMTFKNSEVNDGNDSKDVGGFSVRCIKDSAR